LFGRAAKIFGIDQQKKLRLIAFCSAAILFAIAMQQKIDKVRTFASSKHEREESFSGIELKKEGARARLH
jgi:hypothetical protein